MNDIVQTRTDLPTATAPELSRRIARFANRLDTCGLGHTIRADDAPTDVERQALNRRSARLARWLRPCGRSFALNEVTALCANRGMRGGSEADVTATMAIYVEDLADLPAFALAEACRDFRQGNAGDRKWVPDQGDVRRLAIARAAPYVREQRQISSILAATIVAPLSSPAKREAAMAAYHRAVAALAMPDPSEHRWRAKPGETFFPEKPRFLSEDEIKAAAEERLTALGTQPLPPLSPEALAKFNITPKPDSDDLPYDMREPS